MKQLAEASIDSLGREIRDMIIELDGTGEEGIGSTAVPSFPKNYWDDLQPYIYQPINDKTRYVAIAENTYSIEDVQGTVKDVKISMIFSTRSTMPTPTGEPNLIIPEWLAIPSPFIIGAFARTLGFDTTGKMYSMVAIVFSGWKSYADMNRYLNDPEYGAIRDAIVETVYSELLHEFTHIRDVIPKRWEKEWGARKHEGRAVMQQVVTEVLSSLEENRARLGKFRIFYFDDVVAALSPKYKLAEEQMTQENLDRILVAVYQAMVEKGYGFKRAKKLRSLP
jgi:hypothetical protein